MGGIATVPGRGRKPKPTARKKAAGNPGKRALNDDEPDFGVVCNIDPPEWITGAARDMWFRITPLLCREKVLQETDIHNVEVFCTAYGNWRLASIDVAKNGVVVEGATGGPVKNPALTALNEATKQMAAFGAMLGLDPASRTRIMGGRKSDKTNPFGKLISAK
ncbi:phage terminase small subunit P27 family [Duganella sp. FT92W]|uniref:Phage terminase small subunit P27 family n=1 Tax=Pseudoduganella rivuli TaxID=2666085 RepID=A0A7X2IM52_9BURK|nr:phage terminase small subunit P27 family [Pseudoduganella rivuli]MRV72552.1 phage terminase small subunit P27 family [Pseudoduganella rivuli]